MVLEQFSLTPPLSTARLPKFTRRKISRAKIIIVLLNCTCSESTSGRSSSSNIGSGSSLVAVSILLYCRRSGRSGNSSLVVPALRDVRFYIISPRPREKYFVVPRVQAQNENTPRSSLYLHTAS